MLRLFLFISFTLSFTELTGQYTYFNHLYGEFGDEETEAITNVEILEDFIFLFGGIDNDEAPFSFLLRKLNLEGELIAEEIFPSSFSQPLIGFGWSVNSIGDGLFLFTQAASSMGETIGLAKMYNSDLEEIWEQVYDFYPPYTYLRANWDVGDGIIISGTHDIETPDVGGQAASFLLKIDYDGEVIWLRNIKEANGLVYYNHNLVNVDNGILLGGMRNEGLFTAMLTKTDLEGNVEWEYFADNFVDDEGEQADTRDYRLMELSNGEIVGGHMVWYEFAGSNPSPNNPNWWTSLHLSKINVADTSLYWEHDYLTDHELKTGLLWKIITTQDEGVIAMGMNTSFEYTWLLKVDSLGNEEWFKTYPFDAADFEAYKPYDIEMTSDGGFVIVGEHYSLLEDNFKQSWVMKIDACGDVEWQGCDYVGIQESKKRKVKVYPNPTSEFIQIEGENLGAETEVNVYDLYGRLVINQTLINREAFSLAHLSGGLYQVILVEEGEVVYREKVVLNR